MKRFLLAPDSFKGTMDAWEVCDIWENAIRTHIPNAQVTQLPMADGGEGMVDAYMRVLGGRSVTVKVRGPLGDPVNATYAVMEDGRAVMEMASAAGLPLIADRLDPLRANTYGVGEMISHAAQGGIEQILLGIGGSATNDCGIGMAEALGYRFVDANGQDVAAIPANFQRIHSIIAPSALPNVIVTAACDVDNPLYGPKGATAVFGPQKGVNEEQRPVLDSGLKHMADLIQRDLGKTVGEIPGAGAAGGLGSGLMGFLGASLQPGVEMLLDTAHFDALLAEADILFVGEGRMDAQSVHGKAPVGASRRAKAHNVRCIALCGSLGEGVEAVYSEGIDAVYAAIRSTGDFETIKKTCREDMRLLADAVVRTLCLQ